MPEGSGGAETLRRRIAEAVERAPKRSGRGPDLARYLADRHFAEMVGWLAARQRQQDQAAIDSALLAALVLEGAA